MCEARVLWISSAALVLINSEHLLKAMHLCPRKTKKRHRLSLGGTGPSQQPHPWPGPLVRTWGLLQSSGLCSEEEVEPFSCFIGGALRPQLLEQSQVHGASVLRAPCDAHQC